MLVKQAGTKESITMFTDTDSIPNILNHEAPRFGIHVLSVEDTPGDWEDPEVIWLSGSRFVFF